MEGSLHMPPQTLVGLGDSRTQRLVSGNSLSRFHGGCNTGRESTQKCAIDQSLITCSLVTVRAQMPGEVSTSGRASLLVISALLNFSLWTAPLLYIDSETWHWVNTHRSGSEVNLHPGESLVSIWPPIPKHWQPRLLHRPLLCYKEPSLDLFTHFVFPWFPAEVETVVHLDSSPTPLGRVHAQTACFYHILLSHNTLRAGTPLNALLPQEHAHLPQGPLPHSLPLENESHGGVFTSLVPVRGACPCLGPCTADLCRYFHF